MMKQMLAKYKKNASECIVNPFTMPTNNNKKDAIAFITNVYIDKLSVKSDVVVT